VLAAATVCSPQESRYDLTVTTNFHPTTINKVKNRAFQLKCEHFC